MKHLALLLLLFAPCLSFGQKPIEVSLLDGRNVLPKRDQTWDYIPSRGPNQQAEPLRVEPLESLIALMKQSPEVFTQGESESQAEFFSKLRTYFNKADFNGKKLKDTFFLLHTDFIYHTEEQEFITTDHIVDAKYVIASRANGVYGYGYDRLSLKMPPDKATELRPYLRLAVNALPVNLQGSVRGSERVVLLPVKYVIYDDRDKKILATISTKNDLGDSGH